MRFIWELFLKFPINWVVAPIAYLFRKRAQRKKNWLWLFLSDDNMYGDANWKRKKLPDGFRKAVWWMYRNPLVNRHFKDRVDGKESNFKGTAKKKHGNNYSMWCTMIGLDTGDWHGKIPDFESILLGYQDITFIRTDKKGNVQKCFRKSMCVPFRFLWWIMFWKTRKGHEDGLMIYGFGLPTFRYKKFKKEYKKWKSLEYKILKIT